MKGHWLSLVVLPGATVPNQPSPGLRNHVASSYPIPPSPAARHSGSSYARMLCLLFLYFLRVPRLVWHAQPPAGPGPAILAFLGSSSC